MKSLIFWAGLALVAAVSASWIQKDQIDPSGGNEVVVAQQQPVAPQFPAQARSGEVEAPGARSMMPGMPGVPTRPPEAMAPPMVMPRAVPGVPGPPPQAQVAVPANTPPPQLGMMQRRGVVPPVVTRTEPGQSTQPAPAPVQTAIPFSR